MNVYQFKHLNTTKIFKTNVSQNRVKIFEFKELNISGIRLKGCI